MDIYLNGTKIAPYGDFKEQPTANAPKNITLNGQLYVDVINQRRGWTVAWTDMKAADYAVIRAIYDAQFKASGTMVNLAVPQLGLNTYVWVDVNERYMRYNNRIVEGFMITLSEQYAVS